MIVIIIIIIIVIIVNIDIIIIKVIFIYAYRDKYYPHSWPVNLIIVIMMRITSKIIMMMTACLGSMTKWEKFPHNPGFSYWWRDAPNNDGDDDLLGEGEEETKEIARQLFCLLVTSAQHIVRLHWSGSSQWEWYFGTWTFETPNPLSKVPIASGDTSSAFASLGGGFYNKLGRWIKLCGAQVWTQWTPESRNYSRNTNDKTTAT